ncbi:hypothetical protein NQT69_08355 [Pseudoalteromonas shioyasakiensis]|uniref:hypothetical protein n=1 Tax=Pseudoalteromonas shioyasakiensis TaxID=1190813 RepID=UPI002118E9E3|nr:hypothetical protein [Pseudoalteromonas shioyasakiensis]MCQ8878005.1 hypothetical protein [Pseudoalteromonas shioyasakiensis]
MKIRYTLLYILIGCCLSLHAWYSASKSLTTTLEKTLPALTVASLKNSVDDRTELSRMSSHLLAKLKLVDVVSSSPLALLDKLEVTELALAKHGTADNDQADLSWVFGEYAIALTLSTKPRFKLFNLMVLTLILTLITVLLENLLNTVIYKAQRFFAEKKAISANPATEPEYSPLYELLNNQTELSANEIDTLCENEVVKQLCATQLQWLIAAINNKLDIEAAINVATTSDSISFDLANQQVYIHGLAIRLAKTPLFYYYWYAQREVNQLPPYINPPTNKPDTQNGEQLAQLMIEYKGHQKAIRDLQEEGLKGKTLDQNRNKIKAELQKAIGKLAENYLFISERDIKTARYKYRLNSQDKKITL